jgi:signal transduction histidine kinase
MNLPASVLFTPEDREAGVPDQVREGAHRHGIDSSKRLLRARDGTLRDVIVTVVRICTETGGGGYCAFAHETPPASLPGARREIDDELATRTEDPTSQLAEANARLTTEIADRTQAEAARHRLLRRLVVAQEEERRRIARDLHDDLGQRLTALRLKLEAIETSTKAPADLSDAIAGALGMVAQIDQGLDFLAWELRPAALDELGLAKVLENYVQEWSRHMGIPAVFLVAAESLGRLAPEVESSVYRIAQEALNNVAKHAHARSVNVLLEQRGDAIRLVVEDDGAGFETGMGNQKPLGLTGMRERAAAVGGTVEIEPTPGGGTTVLARIPVSGSFSPGRDGARWPADEEAPAVPSVAGLGTGAASTGAALSSLRARLQELQQAVAARDEFIATVAHELRNPVAPLVFHVRLAIDRSEQRALAGEALSADWVQAQLRRVEQRLHRLLETLDRLLDVSRLSTGRIDLQPEPVDLAAAVREVIGTCEAELAVARCTVTVSERHRATGSWDRVRLEQICRNLLSNAIRFGAGRPITVTVDADRDVATLEVRDEGVGIPPHLHTRIFERFERGMEQRSGGFGIGLWVVKNICLAMGGTISVQSTVGEGACFTVMLPRGQAHAAVEHTSQET